MKIWLQEGTKWKVIQEWNLNKDTTSLSWVPKSSDDLTNMCGANYLLLIGMFLPTRKKSPDFFFLKIFGTGMADGTILFAHEKQATWCKTPYPAFDASLMHADAVKRIIWRSSAKPSALQMATCSTDNSVRLYELDWTVKS